MKKVFIRGNNERGSEVIKMLEDLGGVNNSAHEGAFENNLYYVNTDSQIDFVAPTSELGTIIQECFEELHLPESIEKLPNTWEEWVKLNLKIADEYFIADDCTIKGINSERRIFNIDANLLATKEDAEAILALIKLKRLRDTYRQGWVPDWKTDDYKYSIEYYKDNLNISCICLRNDFLTFQSKELRDKFLENFKDLIEQAKEFI